MVMSPRDATNVGSEREFARDGQAGRKADLMLAKRYEGVQYDGDRRKYLVDERPRYDSR